MKITQVNAQTLPIAGWIHSMSWQASHREFCTGAFLASHTPTAQMAYLQGLQEQGKQVYLLEDSCPVGIVSVDGDLIENLYVLPEFQRQGYGQALVSFAAAQCSGTPRLWVLSANEGAIRLYARLGFVPTGRVVPRIGMEELEMALTGTCAEDARA